MGTAFTPTPLTDTLPSMIGFASERLGFPECEWTSPCYLLADRDLAQNEVVSVWAVDKVDGRVLKVVELKASGDTCKRAKWPAALVKAICDNDTPVENSKLLHAGRINGDKFDTNGSTPSTSDFTAATSCDDYDRLWVFSSRARLFTNAPFLSNQVIANNLAEVAFATAQHLCVQVRDSDSQHLHESFMVDVTQASDARAKAEALCKSVAEQSRMLRAGVLGADGVSITVGSQGNALWVPQYSGLAVTVDSLNWLDHGDFKASRALTAKETLRIHVHDDITGLPLPGSPFKFVPGAEELEVAKWPKALAEKLKASSLGCYLGLKLDSGAAPVTGKWQRAGIPLRIWMSEPLQDRGLWVPIQPQPGQPGKAVSLQEWLSELQPSQDGCVIELQDRRTGHVLYRWRDYAPVGNYPSAQLVKTLREAMVENVPFEFRAGTAPWQSSADEEADPWTLWLPDELGITAVVRWEIRFRESGYYPETTVFCTFSKMLELPERFGPYRCTGDTLTILCSNNCARHLRLSSSAIKEGVRFVPCMGGTSTADLLFPGAAQLETASVMEGYITRWAPWDHSRKFNVSKPVDAIASFNPGDTLCADRCMTLGAHVYDTSGIRENGVDENTGLFHAHYPMATLRGLGGKGPEKAIDLTYSPVRANEGALGDGWAFRFSYFDNRRRILTLSTGQTLTLTKEQMRTLSADKTSFLDKEGYRITGVEGNEDELTTLTIQTPAGEGGQQEVLSLPATHDNEEASEAFKKQYKEKLTKVIANLTHWIDKENISSGQIEDLKKQRTSWQTELPEIDRKALVLVTSSIRSPQGGELEVKWEGIKGHIRLLKVTDQPTGTVLLEATHPENVSKEACKSTFTVWPNTPESYAVTLAMQNCLLTSVKRHRIGAEDKPERYVRFGYDIDYALDRVLTSIFEEDGSVEAVSYIDTSLETAPRVQVHTLIPGGGQPCIAHTYQWKGKYNVDQLRKWSQGPGVFVGNSCEKTNWTTGNGVRVISAICRSSSEEPCRSVKFEYPTTAADSTWKPLVLSRPGKITTTDDQTQEETRKAAAEELLEEQKNILVSYFKGKAKNFKGLSESLGRLLISGFFDFNNLINVLDGLEPVYSGSNLSVELIRGDLRPDSEFSERVLVTFMKNQMVEDHGSN